jgi:integrase/recombinase XerD
MKISGIVGPWDVPKGPRRGFGILGVTEDSVPLSIMQKWFGHARIETTAIYTNALGPEERLLAARLWRQ